MSCLGWFYVLMLSKGGVLSPPLSRAPPTCREGPGPVWVRCRHRSQRPFISSLGRWTLHLINNQGNFSILQPVCGHRAGDFITSRSLPVSCSSFPKSCSSQDFVWPVHKWTLASLVRAQSGRQKQRALGFNKDACGVFVHVFGSVDFLCQKEKRWERHCPRQLGRLKLQLRSPERLRLHLPRATDRYIGFLTPVFAHPLWFWEGGDEGAIGA